MSKIIKIKYFSHKTCYNKPFYFTQKIENELKILFKYKKLIENFRKKEIL